MHSANEIAEVNQAQRTYARLEGILMLSAIVIAIGGGAILSNIAGNGNFAETGARIAASERLYRMALSCVLIVTLSRTLLAFALYVTLKPVNSLLAQLGMIDDLREEAIWPVRMSAIARGIKFLHRAPDPTAILNDGHLIARDSLSWNVHDVLHVMEEGYGIVVGTEQDDLAIE